MTSPARALLTLRSAAVNSVILFSDDNLVPFCSWSCRGAWPLPVGDIQAEISIQMMEGRKPEGGLSSA